MTKYILKHRNYKFSVLAGRYSQYTEFVVTSYWNGQYTHKNVTKHLIKQASAFPLYEGLRPKNRMPLHRVDSDNSIISQPDSVVSDPPWL